MEGVDDDRWTQVFTTKRGRPVRADFHLTLSEPLRRRVWEQEVIGTPFERVLDEAITEVTLEPTDGGTQVTIALAPEAARLLAHRRVHVAPRDQEQAERGAGGLGSRLRVRPQERPLSTP